MPPRVAPTVVLFSAPGTLAGIDPVLERAGVRLVRLDSVHPRPIDPSTWLDRASRTPRPDTVLVTSRAAVSSGVRPWHEASGPSATTVDYWAVGPGTAEALREFGARRVHRPSRVGADGIARSMGPSPARRIVYFRSDRAGDRLARALRRQGHRVVDLTVYRLDLPARMTERARRRLTRADLLVVTSPSGLVHLQRQLGRATFDHVARSTPLVVLGERSMRAAQASGFVRTSVARSTRAPRFARHLLQELDRARS